MESTDEEIKYTLNDEETDASQLIDDIEALDITEFADNCDETTLEFKLTLMYNR